MQRRILLTIAYDGSNYYGWQKQPDNSVPTVQGAVEKALSEFFKKEITVIGASRTDRGVHALGQRAVIDVDTTVPVEKLPLAVRPFMPEDIVISEAVAVSDDFHPRFDCVNKTYVYKIYNGQYKNPICRKYTEFCYKHLDENKMDEASKAFLGTHDFKAFAASGNSSKTTVRTIFDIGVKREGDFVSITVTCDGFLYNMIRIIAGTLMLAGEGRINYKDIAEIISSLDRTKAGKTAGPEGLTLLKINYDI